MFHIKMLSLTFYRKPSFFGVNIHVKGCAVTQKTSIVNLGNITGSTDYSR